ncbi:hypothetical protein F0562_020705 [Nyssa sinensis]|uniref:CCHC-type domain-containing protein n=1 Tax=Nyssa sinensis TaxID=561372 RepID=A0A5J5BT54_9ASTE|nr:hypothetical protein F0562_020705 [Nyssa sinensis]
MKTYLKALNLWEAVENDTDPAPLGDDPTIAQLKNYEEQKAKKPRALTCLHSALSETIFLSVMACETPKEIWEKLREEYEGSQRVKNVKLLTLKREFEMHKMKERETVKEYTGKLMEIVNKIKLFGEPFPDSKIVEKMLISLPARFEPKISAIEESCDLTKLTVAELISKLHAQEQRTSLRDDETVEGAFQARQKWKHQGKGNKNGGTEKGKAANTSKDHGKKKEFPPCTICERTNHQSKDCWFKNKPKIECRFCKKLGHIEKNCKVKKIRASNKEEQAQHASSTDEQEEVPANLFMASQTLHYKNKHTWYIDSGCTCHMANNEEIFSKLDRSIKTKVKLGNGQVVEAHGRGTVVVHSKEDATWNWEEEKVERKAVLTDVQQQKSASEARNNGQKSAPSSPSSTPPSSPTSSPSSSSSSSSSSPTSTPRKMRSLTDIYERCNFCVVEPDCFEAAVK